jgi:hypothetical protein
VIWRIEGSWTFVPMMKRSDEDLKMSCSACTDVPAAGTSKIVSIFLVGGEGGEIR